jgi:hypothetical protein
MATKHKSSVSAKDLEALKARGFVEGNPNTIPENISPVLKSQLLQEMGYPGDGSSPNAADLNPSDGHSTGLVPDGQKAKGQQTAMAKDDSTAKAEDTKSKA